MHVVYKSGKISSEILSIAILVLVPEVLEETEMENTQTKTVG